MYKCNVFLKNFFPRGGGGVAVDMLRGWGIAFPLFPHGEMPERNPGWDGSNDENIKDNDDDNNNVIRRKCVEY